jgi:CBS domain-containing protein
MTKEVKTIPETKPLSDCLRIMRDANIGSVVVLSEKNNSPVGIFTERDLVKKMAERGHEVLKAAMSQVMSKPLTIISPSATVWDAVTLMGRVGIRRLPVVEDARLVGILTERDIFRLILANQTILLESMSESFPAATREQLRGIAGRFGLGNPPGRA